MQGIVNQNENNKLHISQHKCNHNGYHILSNDIYCVLFIMRTWFEDVNLHMYMMYRFLGEVILCIFYGNTKIKGFFWYALSHTIFHVCFIKIEDIKKIFKVYFHNPILSTYLHLRKKFFFLY